MIDGFRVESSTPEFVGRIFSLYRDAVAMPDGHTYEREYLRHIGAVGVVAVDAEDRVVLVNQYRHPVRARLDEIPAGLLDVAGELALVGAQRELYEEAGVEADDWSVLVDLYTSPGMSDEAIRVYLARGTRVVPEHEQFQRHGEEFTMTVRWLPLTEAVAQALAGRITNGPTVAGLFAAQAVLGGAPARPTDAPWPARPGR